MKLFYLAKPRYGGWVTFTHHLAMQMSQRQVFKISATFEKKARQFGYGTWYQNVPPEFILSAGEALITAIDKHHYPLLPVFEGQSIVIHDPTELNFDTLKCLPKMKVITIRKTVQKLLKEVHGIDSEFMLHPFTAYHKTPNVERKGAVSLARIDYDKHTEIILEANKMLPDPVLLYGADNRIYAWHELNKLHYKKYYCGTLPKDYARVDRLLRGARYAVDMSSIHQDGAGTQYTFLEAIYAGTPLILNSKWFEGSKLEKLRPGVNCFAVKNAKELADIIINTPEAKRQEIANAAEQILKPHMESVKHATLTF